MITRYVTPRGAMKVYDCVQGTEEWENVRKGRPTASGFDKIITAAKAELSKSATGYIYKLLADCFVTDVRTDFAGTQWTDRGTELEPLARAAFRDHTGLQVAEVGFVTNDGELLGCSPDGLIVDPVSLEYVAGVEIKCPSPAVHVSYVDGGVLPLDYFQQLHGSMAVTGLDRWAFFSFCGAADPDRMDDPTAYKMAMQPFYIEERWNGYTDKVRAALEAFIPLYEEVRERLLPKLRIPKLTPETAD